MAIQIITHIHIIIPFVRTIDNDMDVMRSHIIISTDKQILIRMILPAIYEPISLKALDHLWYYVEI